MVIIKLNKWVVYTFLFSLLVPGALAVATPGTFIRDFVNAIKGFLSGATLAKYAYPIGFILYFIIFLAIFIEGLRLIPLFGAKGEVNTHGKAFAAAAAGLGTLALFLLRMTPARVGELLAPFGIWGGLILAAVMALITFKFIHDTDLFKEHILIAMAIAGAVGVTLAGFFMTMNNLVGWGFFILLIAFIVGAIVAIYDKYWGGSGAITGVGGGPSPGGTGDTSSGPSPGGDTGGGRSGGNGGNGGDDETKKLIKQILKRLDNLEAKFGKLLEQILAILKKLPKKLKLGEEDLAKIKALLDAALVDFKKDLRRMMEGYFDEIKKQLKNHDKAIKKRLKEIKKDIKKVGEDVKTKIDVLLGEIKKLEDKIKELKKQLKKLEARMERLQESITEKLEVIEGKMIKQETVDTLIFEIEGIKRLMEEHKELELEIKVLVEGINNGMAAQDKRLKEIYDLLLKGGHLPENTISSIGGDLEKINNNIGRAKVEGTEKYKKRRELIKLLRKKDRDDEETKALKGLIKSLLAWWKVVNSKKEEILSYFKDTRESQRVIFNSLEKNIAILQAMLKKRNI